MHGDFWDHWSELSFFQQIMEEEKQSNLETKLIFQDPIFHFY